MAVNERMQDVEAILTKKRRTIHDNFPCSNESQCPIEVFEQIVRMFEPNRKADKAPSNPSARAWGDLNAQSIPTSQALQPF